MTRIIHLGAVLVAAAAVAAPMGARETSCEACHREADLFEDHLRAIPENFADGVHAEVGLSCHDCHGGNPDPALADDLFAAKDETFAENPYRGNLERAGIPDFCGSCHSNAVYMKRFRPDARVDQVAEYRTSQHGIALAAGDERVATCVDCHGVHGIRRMGDPESAVFPTRVAETCATCHSNSDAMGGHGEALPTNQFALWRRSVHATAMFEREDLTAPTCNDCHGNHGATPPGLESVTFVCGQCHGREAEIFRASSKRVKQEEHAEFLVDAGEESCAACHDEPQASVTGISRFGECTTCHGNHGIVRPTIAMFSSLPETPCAFCHEAPEVLADVVDEPEASRKSYEKVLAALLASAQEEGLEGAGLFDHLVDRALTLPFHQVAESEGEARELRPEFARLFERFRIGKTHFVYQDPDTGEERRAEVVRCEHCHASADVAGEAGSGAAHGVEVVSRTHELTVRMARAERILLAARRGGVETRSALTELDQAVDSQVGLQVLVHAFEAGDESAFTKRYLEGLAHADAALVAGQEALDELGRRRKGLALALGVIVLVLIALGIKIQQVSRESSG